MSVAAASVGRVWRSDFEEGRGARKLLDLVVLGPAVVVAAVPAPWRLLAGVVPTFWPVAAVVSGTAGGRAWVGYLVVGLVAHGVVIATLARRFGRRTD